MENAACPLNVNSSTLRFETPVFDQPYPISDRPPFVPVSLELELSAAPSAERSMRNVLDKINYPEPSCCKRSWHWDRSSFGISSAGVFHEAANVANYDPSVSFNFITSGSTNNVDSGGHESHSKEKSASENNTSNDTELLTLKLFGNGYSHEEEDRDSLPCSKRSKVLFPQGQHSRCQVDGCLADLVNAKDYHKRHKVCELHAKADKVFVAKSIQRFCQQCSRFHPLEEFDENKRSCRRRLAGHNKRRRKAHPTTASNSQNPITNLIRLLTSSFQGSSDISELNKILSGTSELLRLLSVANSSVASMNDKPIQTENVGTGLEVLNKQLLSTMAGNREVSLQQPERNLPHVSSASTAAKANDNQELFLPGSSRQVVLHSSTSSPSSREPLLPPIGVLLESNMDRTDSQQTHCWLQTGAGNHHCNTVNKFRDKHNDKRVEIIPAGHEGLAMLDSDGYQYRRNSSSYYRSFDLPSFPPELTNANSELPSDFQINPLSTEWTDRIVFKLFDRKPGELPLLLQKQILEWLAHSPSNMESYIRPGCVILTIFLSMKESAWERLCADIKDSLVRLINIADYEFWHRGRILVQIGRKIGFISEGDVYVHSLFNALPIPELTFIKPIAIEMGKSVELRVKGRNMKVSCARLVFNYRGSSAVKDLSFGREATENGTDSKRDKDDANEEESFSFQVGPFHGPGRCFIEAEQSGIGGAFPIIIADSAICEEICILESEFQIMTRSRGKGTDSIYKTEMIYFLHEFGWLLESEQQNLHLSGDFSLSRFRWLLIFTVEHNCCSVTLKLLDCLFSIGVQSKEAIFARAMKTLSSEVFLLHRAVKINSSCMVRLLLEYAPPYLVCQKSNRIFTPDSPGPGGLTPLHIAACMKSAVEIIDALTDGPVHVWFSVWASSRDKNGHTPLSYALASGNHSYISFVQSKRSRLSVLDEEATNVTMPSYSPIHVDIESNITSSNDTTDAARIDGNRPLDKNQFSVPNNLASNRLHSSTCALREHFMLGPSCKIGGLRISLYRPFVLPLVAIAAVCVCVCILLKGPPEVIDAPSPFVWEAVGFGSY